MRSKLKKMNMQLKDKRKIKVTDSNNKTTGGVEKIEHRSGIMEASNSEREFNENRSSKKCKSSLSGEMKQPTSGRGSQRKRRKVGAGRSQVGWGDQQRVEGRVRPTSRASSRRDEDESKLKMYWQGEEEGIGRAECTKRVKELYKKEIDTVAMNPNLKINLEMMMLQEAVDLVKDSLLVPLNHELRRVVRMVEEAQSKVLEFEIETVRADEEKIKQIKELLKSVFLTQSCKVNILVGNQQNGVPLVEPDPELKHLKNTLKSRGIVEQVPDHLLTPKANGAPPHPAHFPSSNADYHSRPLSIQAGITKPSEIGMRDVISPNEPHSIPNVKWDKSMSNAPAELLESASVLQTSLKKIELITPNPTSQKFVLAPAEEENSNFNAFLETELERIKATFLNDIPYSSIFSKNPKTDKYLPSDSKFQSVNPSMSQPTKPRSNKLSSKSTGKPVHLLSSKSNSSLQNNFIRHAGTHAEVLTESVGATEGLLSRKLWAKSREKGGGGVPSLFNSEKKLN